MDSLEEAIKELWVWQYSNEGSYYSSLISIYHSKADRTNRSKLEQVYPFLKMAYVLWENATDNGDDLFRAYGFMPHKQEVEILESMSGHIGVCTHCDKGMVKMQRDQETLELRPDKCHCLNCGAKYRMVIKDIEQWEIEQWDQKMRG